MKKNWKHCSSRSQCSRISFNRLVCHYTAFSKPKATLKDVFWWEYNSDQMTLFKRTRSAHLSLETIENFRAYPATLVVFRQSSKKYKVSLHWYDSAHAFRTIFRWILVVHETNQIERPCFNRCGEAKLTDDHLSKLCRVIESRRWFWFVTSKKWFVWPFEHPLYNKTSKYHLLVSHLIVFYTWLWSEYWFSKHIISSKLSLRRK